MKSPILIGTSGWRFHPATKFYPEGVKGYGELSFYATEFDTVENNSSFYSQTRATTFKTWSEATPEGFVFSFKLNKAITHEHKLELTDEVKEKTKAILAAAQELGNKIGALLIQMPPKFAFDPMRLEVFLDFLKSEIAFLEYKPDVAIELRGKEWFVPEVYSLLKKHNVALVSAQSVKYPEVREVTADFAYVRFHGPEKMFASAYSTEELKDWAEFIKKTAKKTRRVYVYFNNTMYGHAIDNARELGKILGLK